MAATIVSLQLSIDRADDLQFPNVPGGRREAVQRFLRTAIGVQQGAYPATEAMIVTGGARATGTVTCATVIATNTVTINGTAITAVTGAAGNNQFDRSGTDTQTAANLAAAINASTTDIISKNVVASSSGAVVTLTAIAAGHSGNAITLASSGATVAVSGARLTGGTGTTTRYLTSTTTGGF